MLSSFCDRLDNWYILICARFVRFVSTPEILERFMRLEKEILQIENSIESNSISKSSSEEGMLSYLE